MDPSRLANKESFEKLLNSYSKEMRVHIHLLNQAISLMQSGTDPTTMALLRSIVKNTFPHYAMTEGACSQCLKDAAARLNGCNLWNHRDVVVAWFEAGLPYLAEFRLFRPAPKVDEAIYLLIAEHCCDGYAKALALSVCDIKLRSNEKFASEVLKRDPSLVRCFFDLRLQYRRQRKKRTLDVLHQIKELNSLDDLVSQDIVLYLGLKTDDDDFKTLQEESAFDLFARQQLQSLLCGGSP